MPSEITPPPDAHHEIDVNMERNTANDHPEPKTVYFISGANRGIGRGLVEHLLTRPNTIVIAGVRDPTYPTSVSLLSLPSAVPFLDPLPRIITTTDIEAKEFYNNLPSPTSESTPSPDDPNLIVVKFDSKNPQDAQSAVRTITSPPYNISHLDVVVAKAGVCETHDRVEDMHLGDLKEHIDINVGGPVKLFQATLSLLRSASKLRTAREKKGKKKERASTKAKKQLKGNSRKEAEVPEESVELGNDADGTANPKFVVISSSVDATGRGEGPFPAASYGASKAMMNYLVRKIHHENEDITTFSLCPRWEQSELGKDDVEESSKITLKDNVTGIIDRIDTATRSNPSDQFESFDKDMKEW